MVSVVAWSITKQAELGNKPTLNAEISMSFNSLDPNISFRILKEQGNKILNDGYILDMNRGDGGVSPPDNFKKNVMVKVDNLGLGTAMQINVYLYELKTVDGLDSLDQIARKTIENFYDKIICDNYKYYENPSKICRQRWLITPEYNLGVYTDSFTMCWDVSQITKEYHSILCFEFVDVHENKYHQLMYVYLHKGSPKYLPISKVYKGRLDL